MYKVVLFYIGIRDDGDVIGVEDADYVIGDGEKRRLTRGSKEGRMIKLIFDKPYH